MKSEIDIKQRLSERWCGANKNKNEFLEALDRLMDKFPVNNNHIVYAQNFKVHSKQLNNK